jgi:hypothetical protein
MAATKQRGGEPKEDAESGRRKWISPRMTES